MKFNEFLNESKGDFQVYHNRYSTVIDEIEKYANSMGYELDKEEYGNAYIDAFFKPKEGATKKDTLTLYKNGKEQRKASHVQLRAYRFTRKALHVQIYGRGNGKYELNMYIN